MEKCKKHPKYKGLREPRVNCKVCQEIWEAKQKKVKYFWSKGDEAILKKWLKSGDTNRKTICKILGYRWGPIEKKIVRMGFSVPASDYSNRTAKEPKKEMIDKISQKEFQALKQKQTLFEIIGDQILSAVKKLPTSKIQKVPIFTGKPEDEEEMGLMLSDSHIGLLVESKDSGGLGAYNVKVFLERLEFLKISLAKIFSIHFRNTPYKVINIFFIGDIIENMVLRASQMRLTDLKVVEQVILATDKFSELLSWLSTIFPEVRIHCVVGNHGRIIKDIGQFAPTDSFDYLIYKIMEQRLSDHKNIYFNISESWWMIVERMGKRFYMEHGDDFRSWIGIPFYGITRGKANIRDLLHQYLTEKGVEANFDYFRIGHIHEASDFSEVMTNGAFPGGSEYSLKKLKRGGAAVQRCFSIHPDFGVTWKRNLILDNPKNKPTIKYYE